MKNCKFYVKSFSVAKVMCEKNYVKPAREMLTHIILNVGTNELPTKKAPDQVVEDIVNLAIKLKRNYDVSISDIITKNGECQKKAGRCKSGVERKVSRKIIAVLKPWKHYNGKTPKCFKPSPK